MALDTVATGQQERTIRENQFPLSFSPRIGLNTPKKEGPGRGLRKLERSTGVNVQLKAFRRRSPFLRAVGFCMRFTHYALHCGTPVCPLETARFAREFAWLQFRDGTIDEVQWRQESLVIQAVFGRGLSRYWWESGGRQVFPAEFVAFVDDLLRDSLRA